MYVLDTDVLSLLRRPERNPTITNWYEQQDVSELYTSVIAIGEIQRGIVRESRRDAGFADVLSEWLRRVLREFADRILDVDLAIARRWGQLTGDIGHMNSDLLIAATALEHDFAVVTRNVSDFEPTGVRIVNPFEM